MVVAGIPTVNLSGLSECAPHFPRQVASLQLSRSWLSTTLRSPCASRQKVRAPEDDDICDQQRRLTNQLREQWHRFFPQLLVLCHAADEAWVWDLFEMVPSPKLAAHLAEKKIAKLLDGYHIRRLRASEIRTVLATAPLPLAPGAAEAASEHALFLLPGLRLLRQQRAEIAKRLRKLLGELAAPDNTEGEAKEHRDAESFFPFPESEDSSPPRCSAKLRKLSPIEITTPCAAMQVRLPLHGRAERKR